MKAYVPFEITDAMLISSSVAEPDVSEPVWDPSVTYVEGDTVSVIGTNSHVVYEALANVTSNLNNPPATSPTFWIRKSNTNRFRMFEYNQGDPTVSESPFTVAIRPGKRIDAIMLDGLKASLLDVTVRDGSNNAVVFTIDADLSARNVTTYYDFFFAPFVYTKKIASFAIPPVADPIVYITLSDPSGTVEVGRCAIGLSTYLGASQNTNPIVDSDNYSEIKWDGFGKATLTPIPSIPTVEQKIALRASRLNLIRLFKEKADAKAVVWSGLDDIDNQYTESMILFGVYRNFQFDLSDPNYPVINLNIKGI